MHSSANIIGGFSGNVAEDVKKINIKIYSKEGFLYRWKTVKILLTSQL